jgi:hypothetical protein
MPTAVVNSIDAVSTKGGADAWQVLTDYPKKDADGRIRGGLWLPRPGPVPMIGQEVSWGSAWFKPWAEWDGMRRKRLEVAFDPADPGLYRG